MSSRTWFTSDQHFGHAKVVELSRRPFASLEQMEGALIDLHNQRVSDGDLVWHLGDFSIETDGDAVAGYLGRLRGHHRLVIGNHDGCHPSHRRGGMNTTSYLAAGFELVVERCRFGETNIGAVFLSHLPLLGAGDHGPEERYAAWRPTAEILAEVGTDVLLHGHVHNEYLFRIVGEVICVNVGVDVWGYGPVSGAEVGRVVRAARAELAANRHGAERQTE